MSHIVSFSVENLSGRNGVYAKKLNRDINIFFGLNGSGKTSLLKILHSAMSGNPEILNNVTFKKAEVRIYSVSYAKEFTLSTAPNEAADKSSRFSSDLFASVDPTESSWSMRRHLEPKYVWTYKHKLEGEDSTKWRHTYLPTSRLYVTNPNLRRVMGESVLSEEQLDAFYADSLQTLWVKYANEVLNVVRRAQADGLANILKAILSPQSKGPGEGSTVDPATAYRSAAAFLRRQGSESAKILGTQGHFEVFYKANPQISSIISDINEVEQKIERAMAPRIRLQELITSMFSNNKRVVFEDKAVTVQTHDNAPISVKFLSSGEKHLLRIFIEALTAQDSTAIIDEPELSLHIDWQRDLVNSMQRLNPTAQYILATHSPEIMSEVSDDKIFPI